ncbi:hypothetical protein AMC82_PC00062 (plasmid) [Rhizobium phaseoli]|uniref:Uncharacterized protein n=2 Tax=Rhizobium TaxID=379 RepID=A0ABM6CHZ8_9HYPH|nr:MULTISPECIES: hypothetical protein [Rhizobium]AIC31444.1 hypothetical protein IE4771_PE00219 [Rhizobium sp. IE4771]ANL68626.1 hypothetical protein AMC84_PC00062 [Rhizobium phaseoli]ANL81435.1 hypothetical protein AMC82_PC00062 [Rhizobium phaseoli]ANL87922.1 hypothetical protein AMC81_PD00065 [Rhizobium phaseoli]ANL94431.1 hypothetical protein AMC80_PD00065 [Rhizobium phaseoli]
MLVIFKEEGKAMTKILNMRQIVVSSDRLYDCKESLESEFRLMIDHALSVGWSLDEVAVAVNGLVAEEIAVPERVITLH